VHYLLTWRPWPHILHVDHGLGTPTVISTVAWQGVGSMSKHVGILTAGGDSPGLNAAIRGVGRAAQSYGMYVIGFRDGFRGLMENRSVRLEGDALSGILTIGGTILGTSRDKPHRMPVGGQTLDMTDVMFDTYRRNDLDVLVCLGGGGTIKHALRLSEKGMNVIVLPKTIDNDVPLTDVSFGFDTALGIATEAIDRLHSTAHSHHRVIVVEIMGHSAGWLTLGAGIAGGADVILIPEIPYDIEQVVRSIRQRRREGKRFSIVAVAEGAMSAADAGALRGAEARQKETQGAEKKRAQADIATIASNRSTHTERLAQELEDLTGLEARVTILGYVQRGGTPSAADRLLATRLGTACAAVIEEGTFGVMVAARGDGSETVPLTAVAGQRKVVPPDHPWIRCARSVGTSFGD
jgi:ATP-dependent phosphofructokinase / diphosphate-dependent phosphofructokinase